MMWPKMCRNSVIGWDFGDRDFTVISEYFPDTKTFGVLRVEESPSALTDFVSATFLFISNLALFQCLSGQTLKATTHVSPTRLPHTALDDSIRKQVVPWVQWRLSATNPICFS